MIACGHCLSHSLPLEDGHGLVVDLRYRPQEGSRVPKNPVHQEGFEPPTHSV